MQSAALIPPDLDKFNEENFFEKITGSGIELGSVLK